MDITIDNGLLTFIIIAGLWTLPWKAWSLWIAARNGEKWWFAALLVVNTLGVLEMLYIFVLSKRKKDRS